MLRKQQGAFYNTLYLRRLGQVDAHPKHNHRIWLERTKEMFGPFIASRCTPEDSYEVFQLHSHYCHKLRIALLKCEKINPDAFLTLLYDCNVGYGEYLAELVDIILTKEGAETALEYARFALGVGYKINTENFTTAQLIEFFLNKISRMYSSRQWLPFYPKTPVSFYYKLGHKEVSLGVPNQYIVACLRFNQNPDANPTQHPLIRLAKNGDLKSLSAEFEKLGDKAKEVFLSTKDELSSFNLLDAAICSGSLSCTEWLIKIAGEDINRICDRPLDFYTLMAGSISCLKRILRLKNTAFLDYLHQEQTNAFYDSDSALNSILIRQDLPALYCLLEWLKENDKLDMIFSRFVENISLNSDNASPIFCEPTSGAMLHLLDQYLHFSSKSTLIKLMELKREDKLSISTSLIMQEKLKQLKSADENTISSSTSTIPRR